jgi:murein DD-endopeptidase MepM/ murein hydrolase activator NlpD
MKNIIFKYKKLIISIFVVLIAIFLYNNKPYSLYEIQYISDVNKDKSFELQSYYLKKFSANNEKFNIKRLYVKKNQNLATILTSENINIPKEILIIKKNNCFDRININDEIIIKRNTRENSLIITKKNRSLECVYNSKNKSIKKIEIDKEEDSLKLIFFNNISGSFYNSAIKSGLNPNEIMSFADIFGWDIDFSLDIRKGDSFGVVVERKYQNNRHVSSKIKYAIFKNNKRYFEAFRYKDKYFDSNGNSMRKQFLRAPIDFYRISSHFNKKRLHPIFKTVRPHLGTDYAAPKGTPVYSTGDGTIIYKGKKGGYGNTIIIKHGNIYSTLYAHFSKFKKGTYVGKKVKQKEVIGFVGSTGYSTGPHVHYEFRVRGVHKNSLKIKFKKGKKLNKKTILKMQNHHEEDKEIYSWLNENYNLKNYD